MVRGEQLLFDSDQRVDSKPKTVSQKGVYPCQKLRFVKHHLLHFGVMKNLPQKLKKILVSAKLENVEHVAFAAAGELDVADSVFVRGLEIYAHRVALFQELQT
jgi:hypothetical protein